MRSTLFTTLITFLLLGAGTSWAVGPSPALRYKANKVNRARWTRAKTIASQPDGSGVIRTLNTGSEVHQITVDAGGHVREQRLLGSVIRSSQPGALHPTRMNDFLPGLTQHGGNLRFGSRIEVLDAQGGYVRTLRDPTIKRLRHSEEK
jgi:hypothetical protein